MQTGYRTLNGSGPLDWYLGSDPGNLADIIGSSLEQQYGYRIYDCELQILENNNALIQMLICQLAPQRGRRFCQIRVMMDIHW